MIEPIRIIILENAVKYNGKANLGAVMGKILAEHPELKKDIAAVSKQVKVIVNEINSLSPEEQKNELGTDTKEKKENKKGPSISS